MKKRLMAMALSGVMAASLAGCGGSSASSTTAAPAESTQAAADVGSGEGMDYSKYTGKVVIYTSMYEDIIDAVSTNLKDVFPNLDIEFFQGGTGTIQSKVAAEMGAGKLGCDLLMVAEPSYSLEMMDAGYLHPYVYPEADKLVFDYDKDGYWYPVRVCNMVLAYNPEMYKKEEVSETMQDFAAREDLKDYISMSNPLTSGTAMASVVGLLDKYGEEYFANLGKQNVAVESGSVALTKLETGECKEIMVLEESVLKKRQEEDSSLEVIYPTDGTVCIPSTIMIVDGEKSANNNVEAAEAVENFFLSKEGQKFMVDGWMHSVRSDVEASPYDAIPLAEIMKNNISVDWEKCYKERDAIRTMFQEHVTVPES